MEKQECVVVKQEKEVYEVDPYSVSTMSAQNNLDIKTETLGEKTDILIL